MRMVALKADRALSMAAPLVLAFLTAWPLRRPAFVQPVQRERDVTEISGNTDNTSGCPAVAIGRALG